MSDTCTPAFWIESKTTLKAKIEAIDVIIAKMEEMLLTGATTADIDEYSEDTGQTRVRVKYRDLNQVNVAIIALERRKNKYINDYNGRGARARNLKNFYPGG